MSRLEEIRATLQARKITDAQIDPFGYCNAKCWFCPVRYEGNPRHAMKHMPVDLMDAALSGLRREMARDGIVSPSFRHIYTAHYNEILLYKHLEEFFALCKCYGFTTMVLTNGINLTPARVELLVEYKSVISGVNLNVPAFEDGIWQERSGITNRQFPELVDAIRRTMAALPDFVADGRMSIGVNCPDATSASTVSLMGHAPRIDMAPGIGELGRQVDIAKTLFPGLHIYPVPALVDRAGRLRHHNILSNEVSITPRRMRARRGQVSGCSNGPSGRMYGWLHVNALGDCFLCCDDYNMAYTFGNLGSASLRDIWLGDEHALMLERAMSEICTACVHAEWS